MSLTITAKGFGTVYDGPGHLVFGRPGTDLPGTYAVFEGPDGYARAVPLDEVLYTSPYRLTVDEAAGSFRIDSEMPEGFAQFLRSSLGPADGEETPPCPA